MCHFGHRLFNWDEDENLFFNHLINERPRLLISDFLSPPPLTLCGGGGVKNRWKSSDVIYEHSLIKLVGGKFLLMKPRLFHSACLLDSISYRTPKYVIYQSTFALKTSCPFLLSYLSKQSDFTFLLRYYTLKKWKSLSSCSQYLFLSLSLSFAMPSFTTIFLLLLHHVPQCVIFLIIIDEPHIRESQSHGSLPKSQFKRPTFHIYFNQSQQFRTILWLVEIFS